MAADVGAGPFEQLSAALIGYFPFDGTLDDPVTLPRQRAEASAIVPPSATDPDETTRPASPVFVPAWGGHQAVQVTDPMFRLGFPPLRYDERTGHEPSGFAVSLWARLDAAVDFQPLLFDNIFGFQLSLSRTGISYQFGTTGASADAQVEVSRWIHIALSVSIQPAVGGGTQTLSCWIDGERMPDRTGPAALPLLPFQETSLCSPDSGDQAVSVRGYCMFASALTDEMATILAADLFEPEAAYNPQREYLALTLDGTASVPAAYDPALDFTYTGGFTLSAWLFTDLLDLQDGDAPTLIERPGCYGLGLNDQGQLAGWVTDGEGNTFTATSEYPIATSQWIHAALTVVQNADDSTGLTLYMDGSPLPVTTPLNSDSSPPASTAPVTLGSGWSGDLYSAALFGTALNNAQILALQGSEPSGVADLPIHCVVHYDLGSNPPAAWSATPALAVAPVLPPQAQYAVHSRGAALACGAYVDAGSSDETDVRYGAPFTIAAWIKLAYGDGTQALVGRWKSGLGYSLYLAEGMLCCDFAPGGGVTPVTVKSTIPLPLDVWVQVGVQGQIDRGDYGVALFLNGRRVAETKSEFSPTLGASLGGLAPPGTPLMIGARLGQQPVPDGGGGSALAVIDGMAGYVGSVTFHPQVPDPYYLYYDTSGRLAVPVSADWSFDGGAPTDRVGNQPARLANGAQIEPSRDVIAQAPAASLTATRELRLALASPSLHGPDLLAQIPAEHLSQLGNSPELAGRVVAQRVGGKCYLMAYPLAPGQAPSCALITDDDDPTADWVELLVDVLVIGLGVWGLKAPASDKLSKVGVEVWRSPFVRAAFLTLYTAEAADVPAAFVEFGRSLRAEGFLSKVLGAFNLSWFTMLRIVGLFVPWLAITLLVADLAIVATRIWRRTQRRPSTPAPAVVALCSKPTDFTGAVPITVNGDPVTAMVALTSAPAAAVTVIGSAGELALALAPASLVFTSANWSQPQAVELSAGADDEATVLDGQPVSAVWSGTGVAGQGSIDLRVRVAQVVVPAQVDLLVNDDGDYVADFDVSISAEIAAVAPVTVTFSVEGGGGGDPAVTFEPSSVTFRRASGAALLDTAVTGTGSQSVRAKRARDSKAPDDVGAAAAATSAPKKPCNGQRRSLRITKPKTTEKIVLTMVRAGKGNCFVLRNTRIEGGVEKATDTIVIDGGVRGTYARMQNYLPAGPIKYVLCTHYDDDHIAGLLELMAARGGDVGSLVFNAPAPGAGDSLSGASPFVLFSVAQGRRLVAAALAAGKPVVPILGTPPPSHTNAALALTTLDGMVAGPTAAIEAANLARPRYAAAINRASIMFLLSSDLGDAGFTFLVTGDGYNRLPKLDVTGPAPVPGEKVTFLQVPHHGSIENSDGSLYRAYLAEHYLISSKYSAHRHPAAKVINDIVEAATAAGHRGFNIWISDPDLPADFPFPAPGDYSIYRLNADATGGSFTYVTGEPTVTPDNFTKLR